MATDRRVTPFCFEDIIERGLGITSTTSEKSTVRDLYPVALPLLGEPGGDLDVEGVCLCAGLGLGKEKVVSCGVEGLGGARALATACCLMSSEVSMSDAEIACDLLCVWPRYADPETGGPLGLGSCFIGLTSIN